MRRTEKIANALFRIICLSCSALLLTLSLFWQIRAIGLEEQIEQTQTRIAEMKEERNRREIDRTESLGLAQLEDYATRVLGMQRPVRGQIVTIREMG